MENNIDIDKYKVNIINGSENLEFGGWRDKDGNMMDVIFIKGKACGTFLYKHNYYLERGAIWTQGDYRPFIIVNRKAKYFTDINPRQINPDLEIELLTFDVMRYSVFYERSF